MSDNWIKSATQNKGGLHKSLGIPEGKKIPKSAISKAAHSDDPKIAKQANLAKTLSKLHKRHGGVV